MLKRKASVPYGPNLIPGLLLYGKYRLANIYKKIVYNITTVRTVFQSAYKYE